ncbi:MAG TPA: glycosyltransferase family 2 protein [Bryobacteraceae bacterium]|nr:glycosyltransferase family 2 protein [Bryobacteraceae bacterium]
MFSDPHVQAQLSVVIPAYNEEATLAVVIHKLLRLPSLFEVIVVDDGSTDRTAKIASQLADQHPQIRLLHQDRNQGKSQAVIAGIAATRGDVVVIQDADEEYDSDEIPELIQPIQDGVADAVYGSRFLVRKAARVLYYYHYVANKLITLLSNLLTNINLSDVETGYKAFRGDIIRQMILNSTGFGFELEVTAKLAKLGCAIYEVPISYYGRTYEQGKKIGLMDAFAAVWFIVRYNLFCSLKQSYRTIPSVSRGHQTAADART